MSSTVEQVKDRLNIVDVISSYIKLEKAGVNFKGRCPFHNEKTPSFFVSPTRQSFHCFGCNKGGDVISFVEEIDGLDFKEALKTLADRAGVEMVNDFKSQKNNSEKEELKKVMILATSFYREKLKENKEALAYLTKRGLKVETINEFKIGFAPAGWRHLYDHLVDLGVSKNLMKKAGLINEVVGKDGKPVIYDRFRSRIMFPLNDNMGKPVAFSGRIFSSEDDEKVAKYINSPQTPLYDKSKILYGYDKAKLEMRKKGRAILVEGQMDVVLCHQAGFKESVAVSGTALSLEHLSLIKRLTSLVIMAFDSDSAGIAASRRAVELAFETDLDVKVTKLPTGEDPADVALRDGDLLNKLIKESPEVVDYYLEILEENYNDKKALARAIKKDIYPLVKRLKHLTDKAYYVKKIAETVNMSEELIWQDLNDSREESRSSFIKENDHNKKYTQPDKIEVLMKDIIALSFIAEKDEEKIKKIIKEEFDNLLENKKIEKYYELFKKDEEKILLNVELTYSSEEIKIEDIKNRLILELKEIILHKDREKYLNLWKEAEKKQDEELIDKYLKKCQDISQSINNLKVSK